jgi:hypothetical protein
MVDYKTKYLLYKNKYLKLKNNSILNGGWIDDSKFEQLLGKGISYDIILLLKNIEETTGVELTDDDISRYSGFGSIAEFSLPETNFRVQTIGNPGTACTCMYLSIRD